MTKILYFSLSTKTLSNIVFLCFLYFLPFSTHCQTVFKKDSTYTYSRLSQILETARNENDQTTLAWVYLKLGDYEGDIFSDFGKSLDYYKRSLDYFKVAKNNEGIHQVNQAIARRYIKVGFYSEANQILSHLIENYQTTQDHLSLSSIYFDMANLHKEKLDYELAEFYFNEAEKMSILNKDTLMFINVLFEKIHLDEMGNNLDTALVRAFEVFKWGTLLNDIEITTKSLYHIGYINYLLKDYQKAEKYIKKSLELLPPKPYHELRKKGYEILSKTYEKLDNYREAHFYLQEFTVLNDSLANKTRYESAANLAMKYGAKEKQTSIELLKIEKDYEIAKNVAQRRTLYILAIGLFVVLLSLYFIVKFYDQRIKTNKIINEQREEINQQKIRELEDNIKISNMRSMIEGQEIERERVAKDLHDSLGGLISTIKLQFDQVINKNEQISHQKEYKKAYALLDDAVNEVRTISRNLQPSALSEFGLVRAVKDLINRFEGDNAPEIDFQYYEIPEKIDKIVALSIYRIIQELLNNSIKHAEANEILIQINTEDDELVIQYEDDGVGFVLENKEKLGMGLENIKSRVQYLHGQLHYDSNPGHGISVLIRVRHI